MTTGNKIGIGFRFDEHGSNGVILQSCKELPKHHNREDEVGPFYGVHYEDGEYTWYSKSQLEEIIEDGNK
jgi:hypothetical protein